MASNFGKIRCKNSSFLTDDIFLDHVETIKVVSEEEGIKNGLKFIVPGNDTWISDQWRRGESQTGHFHVVSLQNGLKFSFFGFVLELLFDYGVASSQLVSNAWRILRVFYLGCHILGVMPTSRLFRNFYYLKTRGKFYFFQSRGKLIVTKLPNTNKGWKPLFVRVTDPNGFGVDL